MELIAGNSSKAEIQDFDTGRNVRQILEPDVGGLDVAVDESASMGGPQAVRNLTTDAEDLGYAEAAATPQPAFQGFTGQKWHG